LNLKLRCYIPISKKWIDELVARNKRIQTFAPHKCKRINLDPRHLASTPRTTSSESLFLH